MKTAKDVLIKILSAQVLSSARKDRPFLRKIRRRILLSRRRRRRRGGKMEPESINVKEKVSKQIRLFNLDLHYHAKIFVMLR